MEVRVVVVLLCEHPDPVDPGQGLAEVGQGVDAAQLGVVEGPAVQVAGVSGGVGFGDSWIDGMFRLELRWSY